jgi:polysaccharide pyruvyl transferase WcaK-like protein
MNKIGVFGVNFDNKGAEAMIITLNEYLKKNYSKDFKLVIFYDSKLKENFVNPSENYLIFQGPLTFLNHWLFTINTILYKWLRIIPFYFQTKIVKEFSQCSLCVDLSGFALTDDFSKNSGTRRSLIFLSQALASKLTKKIYIILPQAIGPFKRKLNEYIVKFIIHLSDLVYNRGKYKFKLGRRLKSKCVKTTDIVFETSFIEKYELKECKDFENKVILNPNARIYHKSVSGELYIKSQVEIINKLLSNNFNVVLTPNEIRENEIDDLQICKMLKDKFKDNSKVILNENIEINNLLNLISDSKFIITSRFHLMVFSLILNTPIIVISWSEKYYDIMNSFSIDKYCISDPTKAIKIIDNLLSNFENVKQKIKINLKINSQQINESLSLFLKLLNNLSK